MTIIGLVSCVPLLREGLRALLKKQEQLQLLDDVPITGDLIAHLIAGKCAMAIVDYAGDSSVTARLTTCGFKVLALLRDPLDRNVSDALAASAMGVVPYDAGEAEIVAAVLDTAAGRRHLSPSLMRPRQTEPPRFASLSSREREVFMLIAKGLNNRQIGQVLFISPKTVDTHRGRIYEKLGAHSVADIVHTAYRDGLI